MRCPECGKQFGPADRATPLTSEASAVQIVYCSVACKRKAGNRRDYERHRKAAASRENGKLGGRPRKAARLTQAQRTALDGCTDDWQSAYQIGASLATLDALVKRGILEHRTDALGSIFSPRTANHYRQKPAPGKE